MSKLPWQLHLELEWANMERNLGGQLVVAKLPIDEATRSPQGINYFQADNVHVK